MKRIKYKDELKSINPKTGKFYQRGDTRDKDNRLFFCYTTPIRKKSGMLLLPSINIDASVAEYCMEKYPPEKDKNKFVQCVDDVLEFTKDNKEAAEANNQPASNEIYPSDNFNFLDPSDHI